MFEIRKNLDLRKILVTPEIFLKSRFHCNDNALWDYAAFINVAFDHPLDSGKFCLDKQSYFGQTTNIASCSDGNIASCVEGLFEDSLLNWACFRQTDNSTIHIDISSFSYSLIYFKIIFLFFLGHTKSVDAEIELEMNHHTHPCTFFLARPYSHPCTAHLRIRSNLSWPIHT